MTLTGIWHILILQRAVPFLYAAIGFGLLITVHEFGHFIFCKLFNIRTPIFSIGMGPTLVHKKIGHTDFRLSLIPLGGYCAVAGTEEIELNAGKEDGVPPEESFITKPYWQKLLVMLGGILFNFIFAALAFTYISFGWQHKTTTELTIDHVTHQSAADKAGIQTGDILAGYATDSTNSVQFAQDSKTARSQINRFLQAISKHGGEEISITVHRENEHINLPVKLGGDHKSGTLGVSLNPKKKPIPNSKYYTPLISALIKGIQLTLSWTQQTVNSLRMIASSGNLRGLGGPVMIFSQSYKVAQDGLGALLFFMAILSIGLAVMNLIPFGPLDGGQLLFVTIEALIGRPASPKFKEYFLITTWLLFLLLFIFLSYRDILRVLGY